MEPNTCDSVFYLFRTDLLRTHAINTLLNLSQEDDDMRIKIVMNGSTGGVEETDHNSTVCMN